MAPCWNSDFLTRMLLSCVWRQTQLRSHLPNNWKYKEKTLRSNDITRAGPSHRQTVPLLGTTRPVVEPKKCWNSPTEDAFISTLLGTPDQILVHTNRELSSHLAAIQSQVEMNCWRSNWGSKWQRKGPHQVFQKLLNNWTLNNWTMNCLKKKRENIQFTAAVWIKQCPVHVRGQMRMGRSTKYKSSNNCLLHDNQRVKKIVSTHHILKQMGNSSRRRPPGVPLLSANNRKRLA